VLQELRRLMLPMQGCLVQWWVQGREVPLCVGAAAPAAALQPVKGATDWARHWVLLLLLLPVMVMAV